MSGGGSRSTSWWPAVVGGLWLVAAVAVLVAVLVVRSGSDSVVPSRGVVRLEPVTYQSPAPFTPSVVSVGRRDLDRLASRAVSGAVPASSGGQVAGGTAALYASSGSLSVCDRAKLAEHLRSDASLRKVWAGASGVGPADVDAFLQSLTPLVLRSDTAVTNHVYTSGSARAYQAVLQAGTPVMVDPLGQPRVQCTCGNPLLAPAAKAPTRTDGDRWSSYHPTKVVSVTPAAAPVPVFDTVDVESAKPVKTGSGSNQVLDGTLVAAQDGLFVAPAGGGEPVKVLDQAVDSVFDDGRGGLVYTLAVPGNQFRNDAVTDPKQATVWRLPPGATEAVPLVAPGPGTWNRLQTVGRLGDHTYAIYESLTSTREDLAAGDSPYTVGRLLARDLDTGADTQLSDSSSGWEFGVTIASIGADRLGVGSAGEDAHDVWQFWDSSLRPLQVVCEPAEFGTAQSERSCPGRGVLDEQGRIVGLEQQDTGGPIAALSADPVSGAKGPTVTLAGLVNDADTFAWAEQALHGRLVVDRSTSDSSLIWRIFDLSTGADVTPGVANHTITGLRMLTAPIIRPGHQESSTTPVTTTTGPTTTMSTDAAYLTEVLHTADPSTADLTVSDRSVGADYSLNPLLEDGKPAGWVLFIYAFETQPSLDASGTGYDLVFWAPTKEEFCAKVRSTGQAEFEAREMPGC